MAGKTDIDPRYLTFSKNEVQAILEGVEKVETSLEADSPYPVSSAAVRAAIDGEFYES